MRKFFSGLALLGTVVLLTACQDDLFNQGDYVASKDEVVFRLGEKSTTRAEVTRTIVAPTNVYEVLPEEGDEMPLPLCLSETVTSLDEAFYDATEKGITRGTPVYTENFGTVYGAFYGTAYVPEEGDGVMEGDPWGKGITEDRNGDGEKTGKVTFKPVAENSNTYAFNYSQGQKSNLPWPEGKILYYFLEPVGQNGISNTEFYRDGSIQFDYQVPTTPGAQQDILFTSKKVEYDKKDQNHILFYHALCGVKFRNSTPTPEGATVTIESVSFMTYGNTALYTNGHCAINPNYVDGVNTATGNESNTLNSNNADSKSSKRVVWTDCTGKGTYTLDAAGKAETTYDDQNKKFGDGFYYSNTYKDNVNDENCSQTFFFIPQDFRQSGSKLNKVLMFVSYKVKFANNTEFTHTARVYFNGNWQAGELHTYTLSASNVRVDVDDSMDATNTTKSGLVTMNTGITPEYQRVALSANWVYKDTHAADDYQDIVISQYDVIRDNNNFTKTGGAVGYPNTGTNGEQVWFLGEDDFWYYIYPIEPNHSPKHPLFESYTTPSTAPYKGVHLEMNVLVQAVKFDNVATDDAGKKAVALKYWFNNGNNHVKVAGSDETIYSKLKTTADN